MRNDSRPEREMSSGSRAAHHAAGIESMPAAMTRLRRAERGRAAPCDDIKRARD